MNEAICEQLNLLSTALKDDPRVQELSSAEKAMESDPAARYLAARFDELSSEYDRVKAALGEKAEASRSAWKALCEAKSALDENPSVKRYNDCYREVADLYRKLDDILFHEYRSPLRCGGAR